MDLKSKEMRTITNSSIIHPSLFEKERKIKGILISFRKSSFWIHKYDSVKITVLNWDLHTLSILLSRCCCQIYTLLQISLYLPSYCIVFFSAGKYINMAYICLSHIIIRIFSLNQLSNSIQNLWNEINLSFNEIIQRDVRMFIVYWMKIRIIRIILIIEEHNQWSLLYMNNFLSLFENISNGKRLG